MLSQRFLSVGCKLAVGTVLLLALVSTLVYVRLAEHERSNLLFAKRQTATAVAELFASVVAAPLTFNDVDTAQSDIRNIEANKEIIYAAIWQENSSEPAAELIRPGYSASRPVPVPRNGEQVVFFDDRISVRRSVHDPQEQRVGYVVVEFSLARENAEFHVVRRRGLAISLALVAVLAGALIALTRRMIVQPLDRLAGAAKSVAEGEHACVTVEANDEVGRLAAAFNRMSDAIADREQKLALAHRNTRQLLDNMGQAVFSFGPDRKLCAEHSATATVIFRTPALVDRDVLELLYPGEDDELERGAFRDWIELAFGLPVEEWLETATMAPPEVTLRRDTLEEATLVLAFRPIVEQRRIVRVLVVATDETDKRRIERASREKDERHRRQMATMRQLVSGAHLFLGFLKGSAERLDQIGAVLESPSRRLLPGEIESLFQAAHTLKGEARVFERYDLEARARTIEDALAQMRSDAKRFGYAVAQSHAEAFRMALLEARGCLTEARDELVQSSPIGEVALDQISVRASDVERLAALVRGRRDEVAVIADRLAARPFGELTMRLASAVPAWADDRGKKASVSIHGKEMPVPNRLAGCLGIVLTHIVRNCVVHGIEAPAMRRAAGKDPAGHIAIRCVEGPAGPEVEVADDGAGLDVRALCAKARELGIDVAPGQEIELVFVSGLSTTQSADELSGRGVGMAAVRSELAAVGYGVQIDTIVGQGTTLRLRPAPISVPPPAMSRRSNGATTEINA